MKYVALLNALLAGCLFVGCGGKKENTVITDAEKIKWLEDAYAETPESKAATDQFLKDQAAANRGK